ncbi:MAG: tetratricopeptide repeat protein, partial [Mariprofundaceae bacterium]|nr:tetratricopeptide repeat protein [Mariprofundaceae bacterium]
MFRFLFLVMLLLPLAAPAYSATDLVKQGVAEYKDESFEEAAATLEKAYRKQADNPQVLFYLGMSYMQMLDFDKARIYLEKAAAQQPKDTKLGVYLGEAFYNLHDYKAAEDVLNKVVALGGAPARAYYFLGLTRYRTEKFGPAVAALEES